MHKAVIIPMIDYVPEILKKYNYDLPKIPRYIFNERVKELGRRAKLKQKIEIVRKKGKNGKRESMKMGDDLFSYLPTIVLHKYVFIRLSCRRTYAHIRA